MRKFITSFLIVAIMAMSFTGCADKKTIDGVTYDTYGLLNSDSKQNPNIEYELQWGNMVWGVLLAEFFFIPTIYFFGFSLWEPVGPKITDPNQRGVVGGTVKAVKTAPKEKFDNTIYTGE